MVIKSVRLLYFSPTGTTRKIVEAIAQGYGVARQEHIDMTLPHKEPERTKRISSGLTIIGVPVYTGRVPLEAVRRLERFRAKDAPSIIVVVYGNREYEDALLELKNIATELGFTPCAGGAFIGEHSFSTEASPIARGRPDREDIQRAGSFGAMVRKKTGAVESLHDMPPIVVPGNFPYRERGPARNSSPETNHELCIQCGKCIERCPVEAISLQNNMIATVKPQCILCCACVKYCPTGARYLGDVQLIQFAQKLGTMCTHRKEPELYF